MGGKKQIIKTKGNGEEEVESSKDTYTMPRR